MPAQMHCSLKVYVVGPEGSPSIDHDCDAAQVNQVQAFAVLAGTKAVLTLTLVPCRGVS